VGKSALPNNTSPVHEPDSKMASNQATSNRNDDEGPSKEDMVPCGKMEIKGGDSVKASDGLRGQLNLKQGEVQAIGAKPGEKIWLRVKCMENGNELAFKPTLHNTGRTITLPKDKRAKLDLKEGYTVKYWIGAVEEEQQTTSETEQVSGSKDEIDEYVMIDENPYTYHIQGDNEGETVCNVEYNLDEAKTFSNPGDVPLELCEECSIRSAKSMSNEELARWLGKRAGFEPSGSNPAYLTNDQLTKLRDYILDLEDEN